MTWRLADYSEIGRLGSGATGTVASARHDPTGTIVAIKFLSAGGRGRSTPSDWFRGQIRLLADIENTHIARMYEYIERPAGGAIVMELVDGLSLVELLRRGGPLEPQAALAILKGSLVGLAAAHAGGLLHRDFRPSNVQISRRGVPKIVDFGVVPPVDSMQPGAGTPLYQAPELWDRKPAGARTDLYAAAATFFECLTGRPPYPPAASMAELRKAHEEAPIPVADIPEPLRDLVARGLAKDPAKRPADATTFANAVEHVAAMRYGSDWERAGEAMLLRRLVRMISPPGRAIEVKKKRPLTSLLGSALVTRILVAVTAAAAIVIIVDSGIAATGTPTDNTAANGPGFAVVLPPGASPGVPTSTPALLIIPTPGVTLTAPPARTIGPARPGDVGLPTPIGPPVVGGGSTTTPPPGGGTPPAPAPSPSSPPPPPTTTTTAPPPPTRITGAHLAAFDNDGTNANFSIEIATSGTDAVTVTVSVTEDPNGSSPPQTFPESGSQSYTVSGTVPVSSVDCATATPTLTISTDVAFDGSSLPTTISVACPAPAP